MSEEHERREAARVAAQIGRPLRGRSLPVARCDLGIPLVVSVPPVLEDGSPFPTRYWLTCPLAHRRVARLESAGHVKRFEALRESDAEFAEALAAAHRAYAEERDALVPADAKIPPRGGVGGARRGIKCLHTHLAHHLGVRERAPRLNPVGAWVAGEVEPLRCPVPCVVDEGAGAIKNPAWSEPPLDEC